MQYRKSIDFYLEATLNFKAENCKELITTTELNLVTSLTRLMDSLATKENGVNPKDDNTFDIMVRFFFMFR
jgi:dynein heavy chain